MSAKESGSYLAETEIPGADTGEHADRLLRWVLEHKVEVVCWDFDQTAMKVHTGGFLTGSVADVNQRVAQLTHCLSPGFRLFARLLQLTAPHLKQAIVSFADDFSRAQPPPPPTPSNQPNQSSSAVPAPSSTSTPPTASAAETTTTQTTDNNARGGVAVGGTALIGEVLRRGFSWPRPPLYVVSFYPSVANQTKMFPEPVPYDKSVHLKLVQRRFGVTDPSKILLIDDDLNNLRSAKREGYQAWLVSRHQGFDPATVVIL